MEMRAGFVNHARNVWDRACSLLPRHDVLWYKYTHMEETMGEIAACRNVFEKWMKWEPNELAWNAFVNFELRYKEYDQVPGRVSEVRTGASVDEGVWQMGEV